MLKIPVKIVVILLFSATMLFGLQAVRWNVVEGDGNDAFKHIIEVDLKDIEFIPKDIHPNINSVYKKFYKPKFTDKGELNPKYDPNYKENLDNLGFITIASNDRLPSLLLNSPQLGAFSPFNYLIYKKRDENKTYVGHLTPETMLDITKVTDPDVRAEFTKMIDDLAEVTDTGMDGKVIYTKFDKLPEDTMMNFEIVIEKDDNITQTITKFQKKFEELFENNGYTIAGFRDFGRYYEEEDMYFERYDAYFVYSLCHLKFAYTVFNIGKKPEAAVFAPCSMYMYLEKGSNTLKIGMANVTNWIPIIGIKDKKLISAIKNMQKKITTLMLELGALEK